MTRQIVILGSTGSIGRQALEVIERLGSGYRIAALTARSNAALLAEQVRRFRPKLAVLSDPAAAGVLRELLRGTDCHVAAGEAGQLEAATMTEASLVLVALVGFSGFGPTLAALESGKRVALANKESLVVGGELLARRGWDPHRLLPVDSEHSAIWQCLEGRDRRQLRRIILTASGGPFRDRPALELDAVTPAEALAHPNWNMGPKITIDSATLMNKGFEVLEAHWLFGLELDRIAVVVHPQSIVHSLIELEDGALLAQAGLPDMRLPIQYALTYPERVDGGWPRLELAGQNWSFSSPDRERFPCLDLAYLAGRTGGTAPACLNAANEVAVEQFLQGRICFSAIPRLIGAVLAEHNPVKQPEAPAIVAADRWARRRAYALAAEPDLSRTLRAKGMQE